MTSPRELAAIYFESWLHKDFDTLRSVLHDNATFRGPLGAADSADECVAGLRQMAEIMTGLEIAAMLADGSDVITWFDLHTSLGPSCPVANWSHVEGGLITAIRVAFDPRPIVSAAP